MIETSAKSLFEAIEQFKRDRPEYGQAIEIMDMCREIIAEYQRIVEAQKPKYITMTAPITGPYVPVDARGTVVQFSESRIYGPWRQFVTLPDGTLREVGK